MNDEALEKRIAVEQIGTLFGGVLVSVLGATLAATVLAFAMLRLRAPEARASLVWVSWIVACAAAHILLWAAYRRSRPDGEGWPAWAQAFTAISFAEGLGWGWAPIGLTSAGRPEIEHLVFLMLSGVCAGTIPAFSPYLPAFAAMFAPATCGA